jgi:hypothetical protein
MKMAMQARKYNTLFLFLVILLIGSCAPAYKIHLLYHIPGHNPFFFAKIEH